MQTTESVVIVAGGKGLRTGHELPKQFIPIAGKPVLMHTIEAFYKYNRNIRIIVVLAESYPDYWEQLCSEYNFNIPHEITIGGETRFHSVKSGLALVGSGFVAVHDAARAFASTDLIKRSFEAANIHQAVIPVIDATDSLREINDNGSNKIIDRTRIKLVQTPQVFDVELLKKAYQTKFKDSFTDDASVVEVYGKPIHLVEGETTNIKITTAFDLKIAEIIMKQKAQ